MSKKIRIIERQYRSLFEEDIKISYDNPLSLAMTSLNEGLVMTYPFETMIRYVMDYFNIPEFYMHRYKNNGVECLAIDVPKNKSFQKRIDKAMNLCGYFKSITFPMDSLDRIHYEPKFQEEEKEIGNILYHITHNSNVDKIKKIGLCPYHKNIKYNFPSRIYFFKENTPREMLLKAAKGLDMYSTKKFVDGLYAILKINVDKLPNDVVFHNDPNAKYAIYTMNNIPPSCIIDDLDRVCVK